MTEGINGLKEIVVGCSNVLILVHKSPDGDAVGSAKAWFHFLKNYGKNPTIVFPDRPAANLLPFLDNTDFLIFDLDKLKVADLSAQCDTLFCLDFNTPSRVGEDTQVIIDLFDGRSAMIDHHPNPTLFCDLQISRPEICSTAQLLFHCIEEMGMLTLLDTTVAEGIYLGIMTDTGSFRYPSVDANTHYILGKLINEGLEHYKIHEAIFDVNTIDKLQLRGFAVSEKLVLIPNYPIGYISLTLDELGRFNYQKGDIEGLVNVVLSIDGISIAAIFMESRDGIKISFRSKGEFYVNQFSEKYFQGGGHKYAAGGYSEDSLNVTIDRFKTLLKELIP